MIIILNGLYMDSLHLNQHLLLLSLWTRFWLGWAVGDGTVNYIDSPNPNARSKVWIWPMNIIKAFIASFSVRLHDKAMSGNQIRDTVQVK